MHLSLSRQVCFFLSDRLLCEELVHATFNLLMVSAQESLNFRAHAQRQSVLTCAVVRLSPWPHVTVLCGLNCLSNSERCWRQGCHQSLQPSVASVARQAVVVDCGACLPLFGNCHLGIGDALRNTALNETGNQKMGIGQSSAKHDGSDRPTQPKKKTHLVTLIK